MFFRKKIMIDHQNRKISCDIVTAVKADAKNKLVTLYLTANIDDFTLSHSVNIKSGSRRVDIMGNFVGMIEKLYSEYKDVEDFLSNNGFSKGNNDV